MRTLKELVSQIDEALHGVNSTMDKMAAQAFYLQRARGMLSQISDEVSLRPEGPEVIASKLLPTVPGKTELDRVRYSVYHHVAESGASTVRLRDIAKDICPLIGERTPTYVFRAMQAVGMVQRVRRGIYKLKKLKT